MFYKKKGLPEEGECVLCTVKKILFHSVFVELDEYDKKEGMVHISEVSPGRIRNLRDFVTEGKKIICKVLRIRPDKGHIDLSLRRVSVAMKKKKSAEIKQEQKAEKIMELLAQRLNTDLKALYEDFGDKVWEEHGSLNQFFQEVANSEIDLKESSIPQKYVTPLTEILKEKIKPPTVEVERELELRSEASNGIEVVKEALKKSIDLAKEKRYDVNISYISAPRYRVKISASDYKIAEKAIEEVTSAAISFIISKNGQGMVKK